MERMQPVMTGPCAQAGKAGGAIRGRLELFGSFLFEDKKERKDGLRKKDATKGLKKVYDKESEMLKQVQHDRER